MKYEWIQDKLSIKKSKLEAQEPKKPKQSEWESKEPKQ